MTTEVRIRTTDGAVLWTAVDGSGPPVVLCHGGPGLWDYLGDLAELLCDEFTVHRWDQRMCGRSTGGSAPTSVRRTLEDLEEIRAHFGHDRWGVLGHSWGAELGLLYGLHFPARSTCVAYMSGRGSPAWWREFGRGEYHANRARRMSADQLRRLSELAEATSRDAEEEVEFRWLSWMTDFTDPARPARCGRWRRPSSRSTSR